MKNALLLTSLILFSGIVEAQSKKKPDSAYRVEKEYDKEGTLIRYDSSKVFNNSNSFKTFNFYFKKDSLSKESFLDFIQMLFIWILWNSHSILILW